MVPTTEAEEVVEDIMAEEAQAAVRTTMALGQEEEVQATYPHLLPTLSIFKVQVLLAKLMVV